jgi:uracil-DNA glycosylase
MTWFLRAWAATDHRVPRPRPTFGHGAVHSLPPLTLVASYHPSQRNTQTGLLSEEMFDTIFRGVREILDQSGTATGEGRPRKRQQ